MKCEGYKPSKDGYCRNYTGDRPPIKTCWGVDSCSAVKRTVEHRASKRVKPNAN